VEERQQPEAPEAAVGPMLARLVRELPEGPYLYEPKWDGFRCLAARERGNVVLTSRHGRPFARYFPEVVQALSALEPEPWLLDGELLVVVDGRFDFEALMQRLHPAASRVQELSERTPAVFVAFDAVEIGGEDLSATPFASRRERLAAMLAGSEPPIFVTPATGDLALAAAWLERYCGGGIDGVVAKHRELRYEPGVRAMLKVKQERTADCVVAGMRVANEPLEVVSLLLGLYDDRGTLEHIGVASSFARRFRLDLAQELVQLVVPLEGHPWEHGFLAAGGPMGRLKGAAGRWMPGMTVDWVPLAPHRVAEVRYTQVDGYRLRHPAKFARWRPDREPPSCLLEQLDVVEPPAGQVLAAGAASS
jgi:ATP-dependent DNA ligase